MTTKRIIREAPKKSQKKKSTNKVSLKKSVKKKTIKNETKRVPTVKKSLPKRPNYAFIDNENVNVSIKKQGRKLDRAKFREWLREEYNVEVAYMFMGYLPDYQEMYTFFQNLGFILIFKPINTNPNVPNKGNTDAELVLQAMIEYENYERAVIVSGDGDFACLVSHLNKKNKLEQLIVPNKNRYAELLNIAAKDRLVSMTGMKKKLRYVPPKHEKPDPSHFDTFYS